MSDFTNEHGGGELEDISREYLAEFYFLLIQ